MAVVGTWPQITTMGTESAMQSRTGVTVLVAPGPEVTNATPTRPLARANPAAMKAAPCSFAGTIKRHGRFVILVEAKYRVVNRQNGAAAVTENGVDAFVGQYLNQHVGARHVAPANGWAD